ncbi:hypothetical protein LWE61_06985 [Sphingobium sufflavum]|uniref:hypothetical protein n=1 Tax=Sphingobium sufflavum TaxID=1129547 RepID=UPI001F2E1E40|nr:hypothetical protein [Sphingobium sufflavum]MCE7796306.1 hypothetical protein [Sphingobium sufflavum]
MNSGVGKRPSVAVPFFVTPAKAGNSLDRARQEARDPSLRWDDEQQMEKALDRLPADDQFEAFMREVKNDKTSRSPILRMAEQ